MIDPDSPVEDWWQVRAIRRMCSVAEYFEDPDEVIDEWCNDIAQVAPENVAYIKKTWETIRVLGASEQIRLAVQCGAWLRAHRRDDAYPLPNRRTWS
jgi:hypothetical protein